MRRTETVQENLSTAETQDKIGVFARLKRAESTTLAIGYLWLTSVNQILTTAFGVHNKPVGMISAAAPLAVGTVHLLLKNAKRPSQEIAYKKTTDETEMESVSRK